MYARTTVGRKKGQRLRPRKSRLTLAPPRWLQNCSIWAVPSRSGLARKPACAGRPIADKLNIMSEHRRNQLISPDIADMFRVSDQIAGVFRASANEELFRSTGAIQKAVEQQQAMIRDSVMAQRALGSHVAAALAGQQAQFAAAAKALGPALAQAEAVRTQMRALPFQVPDPKVAESIARVAQQAIARLGDVDKVRVRNALVHWQGVNDHIRRDQLALALATIKTWQEGGARRLREVGALLEAAFDTWVLEPVIGSLRRSPCLLAACPPRREWRPRFNDRLVGWLRDLTCSLSPHAPPACLA